MEQYFQIDPQLDIPIYRQLVDKIRTAVKKGDLTSGQQLPTVHDLADQLSVARGTVKRAYDELERLGLLEKNQGRGTFIRYQSSNSGSRKEQAMDAIDKLLDQLEEIGFSPMEINIFLSLKQRERAEKLSVVKVAIVEDSPENLSQISEQLREIKGIDLYSYLLDTIRQYPYQLDEEIDLVITTAEHAEYLQNILPERKKLLRIALCLSAETLSKVVKLQAGDHVGILSFSSGYGDLLYRSCRSYGSDLTLSQPQLFSAELDMDAFLADKNAVLVPKAYEKYCTEKAISVLQTFEQRGKLISCAYEMDAGSLLYLEEKLQQLRQHKSI